MKNIQLNTKRAGLIRKQKKQANKKEYTIDQRNSRRKILDKSSVLKNHMMRAEENIQKEKEREGGDKKIHSDAFCSSSLLLNRTDNVCVEQLDQRTGHNDSVLKDNTRVERGQC